MVSSKSHTISRQRCYFFHMPYQHVENEWSKFVSIIRCLSNLFTHTNLGIFLSHDVLVATFLLDHFSLIWSAVVVLLCFVANQPPFILNPSAIYPASFPQASPQRTRGHRMLKVLKLLGNGKLSKLSKKVFKFEF